MRQVMLTTIDNPYNPFTDFRAWHTYDTTHGYHSSALLGRIINSSDDLSEAQRLTAIEQAVDEIIEYNVSGMFIKIYKE